LPDEATIEPGISPDTLEKLKQMGYAIDRRGYWSDGECVAVDGQTGERLGASDGRNNGRALGY
jgi:gamma-glutamyltranspeptidase/glutathione hydrolase